jgi:transposase-like protein
MDAPRFVDSICRMRPNLADAYPLHAVLAELRDARFSQGLACPRCGGRRIQRWGSFAGRHRYRCRDCERTFSDLTGTPAAYSKKLALWAPYSVCMRGGMSVRASAGWVGIHPSTAFRWRHRVLDSLRGRDAESLVGWTELGTMRFAYSEKGRRNAATAPRCRGASRGTRASQRRIVVLVGCDRVGDVVTAVLGEATGRRPTGLDLDRALAGRLLQPAILTSMHGRFSSYSMFAVRQGAPYRDARIAQRQRRDALAHVRSLLGYCERFIDWMDRFRGVATRYLANYLAWHRVLDRESRNRFNFIALRWPLGDAYG